MKPRTRTHLKEIRRYIRESAAAIDALREIATDEQLVTEYGWDSVEILDKAQEALRFLDHATEQALRKGKPHE